MKKRVLIYGFFGIENAGNEAMLQAFIEPIRKEFGNNIEFVVASRHATVEYDVQYGVRSISNLEYSCRDEAKGRWLRGLNPDDTPAFMEMFHEVARSDLVVLGPGQYLVETGEFGLLKGSLAQFHVLLMMAKLTGTPFYGLALACESLTSPWSILSINQVLKQCDYLTFRDPQSVINLEAAGIELPEHEVLGDLALAASAIDKGLGKRILHSLNIPDKCGPRLAVALRSIYWLDIEQEKLRHTIVDSLRMWLENEPNADILMIPQNVYDIDGTRDDDRVANRKIYELLPDTLKCRVYLIENKFSPSIIESLYSSADVTLSARLHGSVFSCKQGIPPVVLTFMDKTKGFFKRLEHTDRMVDIDIDPDELYNKIISTYENRYKLSTSILEAVSRIRMKARRYPKVAIDLLSNHSKDLNQRILTQKVFSKKKAQNGISKL